MEKKVKKKKVSKKDSLERLSKSLSKKESSNKKEDELEAKDIIQEEWIRIEIDKERIKQYTSEQLGDWLIDKFYGMAEVINYTIQQDFLNAENLQARFYKLYFATELWKLLEQYEIEVTVEAREYLAKKQEAELLDMLVFLNFV